MYYYCVISKVVCAAADGYDCLVWTSLSLFSHGVSCIYGSLRARSLSFSFLSFFVCYERVFGAFACAPQFSLHLQVPSPSRCKHLRQLLQAHVVKGASSRKGLLVC